MLFVAICPLFLWAQQQPRVGLVLSGGGAKGFAHIGVLKELEKAGVQIDYIGGTSMGAIVGGLYASGYKANQIEEIIEEIDFMSLLQDEVPRREKPYFEKTFLEKHAVSLPIKNGSIGLPLGLSKGQNVLNLFTELLAPVDAVTNFSKLPIPFYCIATNIETGKEVVLDKGSLPLALRASGSFPSLLNPVEINGELLIDGGVVNNFPVDVMETKNVDIIIGVDVQSGLLKRDEMKSIASILGQIINFQMYRKSNSQIKRVDIYMHPKVTEYNVVSFDESKTIITEGVKVAKPFKAVFDSIAKLQKNKKKLPKIIRNNGKFLVDRIIINGNRNYTRNNILGKLKIKEGDSVSYANISKKINTLTATGDFERIDYHLEKSFSGKKLNLHIKEDNIRAFLRLGVHYDLLYRSAVLLNYNHKNLLFKNDELSFDVAVGDKVRYNIDFFLDEGLFGYGFNSRYNSFSSGILLNEHPVINRIKVDYKDLTNRLYAQTTLDKKFAFGFGVEHKHIEAVTETLLANNKAIFFDDSNYINTFAFLKLDTFNKPQFPTKGFYANLGFTWYLWSDRDNVLHKLDKGSNPFSQFSQVDGRISVATTLWNALTFQYTSEAGFTLGEEETGVFDYRLGSYNKNFINNFYPMYGYEVAELSEQSFLRSEFNFRYKIFDKNYINFIANYARTSKNVLKDAAFFRDTKQGYAIGYGLETFLGPIELKYSWSPDHKKKYWLFNLGFWF